MPITIENYYKQYPELKALINSNPEFQAAHAFFDKVTQSGTQFDYIRNNDKINETIKLYLNKLEEKHNAAHSSKKPAKKANKTVDVKAIVHEKSSKKKANTLKSNDKKGMDVNSISVEHIPSDIALIKKFISLHGKVKTFEQILSIWRAFEKATVERRVTKDSPFRLEINTMKAKLQNALIKSESSGQLKLEIDPKSLKEYQAIAHSVEKSISVSMLLEFINISGKIGVEQRAVKLSKRMTKALNNGTLEKDRYKSEIESALMYIEAYLEKETNRIEMKDHALSGLGEISVLGCACSNGLNGNSKTQNAVILKLIQERVKNLKPTELNRAFKDTVAPSICKLIARKLIQAGQLTMSVIRNPAKTQSTLSGTNSYSLDSELMDMRVRQAALNKKPITQSMAGLGQIESNTKENDAVIMSAQQIMNMKFKTIGLTGKYKSLIGDPEPAFSAMIYGKPKQGKSTFAIDLAKELTHFGKVLYCAYEEGYGGTLQDKINRNKANVPGLDFADKLPNNIAQYQFVFIDSVSDAGIDEQGFRTLIKANKPNTSIIGLFHATKDGKFKGGQTFAHDVDVLIKVEDGIAYAQGRYAAPSEMKM